MLLSYDTELNGEKIQNLPICGVFALHLVTAKPLKELYEEFKAVTLGNRTFRGTTYHSERIRVLEKNNVDFIDITVTKKMAVKTAVNRYYKGSPLMIRVCNHVIIIHKGLVFDQYRPNGIDLHLSKYNRKMATKVTEFPRINARAV